ncbi:MAG: hypothetical protein SWX82_35525 [Cyanobacteriota bacterium]|nr:hypothetical protein [Cyanobacteriota bacterium]
MYVHGKNLEQKENHKTKYRDEDSRRYLKEIRAKYNEWKLANEQLVSPLIEKTDQDSKLLIKRVELLNKCKHSAISSQLFLRNATQTAIKMNEPSICYCIFEQRTEAEEQRSSNCPLKVNIANS